MRNSVRWISRLASFGSLVACALPVGRSVADNEAASRQGGAAALVRIEVFPPAIKLVGPRSRMQVVVTGHYADGGVKDLHQPEMRDRLRFPPFPA